MESQNTDQNDGNVLTSAKTKLIREAFKFGIALAILMIVSWALWISFKEDQKLKDDQLKEAMIQIRKDVENLKKENKDCNDFTKSILLREVQESNMLQRDLQDYLRKHQ